MLETEDNQYTFFNPYQVNPDWMAFYFDRPRGEIKAFAIVDATGKTYCFGSGSGMPIDEIKVDDYQIVADYLAKIGCVTTPLSFNEALEIAKGNLVQIPYRLLEELENYLRDRAPLDPRAKQLLEEMKS